MSTKNIDLKKLVADTSSSFHNLVKASAAKKGIKLKDWLIEASCERLYQEGVSEVRSTKEWIEYSKKEVKDEC